MTGNGKADLTPRPRAPSSMPPLPYRYPSPTRSLRLLVTLLPVHPPQRPLCCGTQPSCEPGERQTPVAVITQVTRRQLPPLPQIWVATTVRATTPPKRKALTVRAQSPVFLCITAAANPPPLPVPLPNEQSISFDLIACFGLSSRTTNATKQTPANCVVLWALPNYDPPPCSFRASSLLAQAETPAQRQRTHYRKPPCQYHAMPHAAFHALRHQDLLSIRLSPGPQPQPWPRHATALSSRWPRAPATAHPT